jgi:hypothetical protein
MSILYACFFASLSATLGSLLFGLFAYFRGGHFNTKWGNRAMRWRIMSQAASLVFFLLILTYGR